MWVQENRSCTDMTFVVRQVTEKCLEHRTKAYLVFIDLRKAYDSVPREALWSVLRKLGVPDSLVQLLESFHSNMSAQVVVNGTGLEEIGVANGLRQGCTMAPVLFNLFACAVMERWIEHLDNHPGVGVHILSLQDKRLFRRATQRGEEVIVGNGQFADDAVLIASSHVGAEWMTEVFVDVAVAFGLSVNFTKTKFQAVGYNLNPEDCIPLDVHGSVIGHMDAFRYLGSMVTSDGRSSTDVQQLIAAASRAFGCLLRAVFYARDLSIRTKRFIYTTCVLSVLLYGSESWTLLQQDVWRLEKFHHHCIATILGVSRRSRWQNRISNASLCSEWGAEASIAQTICYRRLEWLGHLARMPSSRLPQKVFFSWFPKKRPFCGPRKRWKDAVSRDLQKLKLAPDSWFDLACDRAKWRSVCHSVLCSEADEPRPLQYCELCQREFRSAAGFKRHKCVAERRKPLQDQEGAVQCSRCDRWFASRGGLSVHRCGCAPPCLQPTSLPEPESTRHALVDQPCCHFHCSTCDRCFKSSPGFSRHNCLRLKSRMSVDRSSFSFVCSDCGRRFRLKQDLTRHKCC